MPVMEIWWSYDVLTVMIHIFVLLTISLMISFMQLICAWPDYLSAYTSPLCYSCSPLSLLLCQIIDWPVKIETTGPFFQSFVFLFLTKLTFLNYSCLAHDWALRHLWYLDLGPQRSDLWGAPAVYYIHIHLTPYDCCLFQILLLDYG